MSDSSNPASLDHQTNKVLPPVPRLILDINVLLNGLSGSQSSVNRKIYQAFLRGHVGVVVSESWLCELERVLDYPAIQRLGISAGTSARAMRDMLQLGECIAPVPMFDWVSVHDRKDWYLLDLLFESAASGLVTQDKLLLQAGKRLRMPIFHPRDLLDWGIL
jgi:putative PIN family toxin of toxin-antitoxin system